MFEWMAWTTPVAVFFCCIVLMLAGMTVWELKSPTVERKGWLPAGMLPGRVRQKPKNGLMPSFSPAR